MVESNPPAPSDCSRTLVIPLPVARYVSGELTLELYDGGQPCCKFSIRGERLVPTKENEPGTKRSQTILRTHQD